MRSQYHIFGIQKVYSVLDRFVGDGTLMVLRVLLLIASLVCLSAQTVAPPNPNRRLERILTEVIQWEILWDQTPKTFHLPTSGSAELEVSVTFDTFYKADTISYCSHALGACTTYLMGTARNWQGLKSAPCEGSGTDEEALLLFVGAGRRTTASQPRSQTPVVIGPGGLGSGPGSFTPDLPIRWAMSVKFPSREEIVQEYRQLHPSEADSLRTWLSPLKDSGYISVTFACFKASNPLVHIYGDRATTRGPIIISAFWDRDQEEWIEAGILERNQGPDTFDVAKSKIDSIACDTIHFK